MRSKEKILAIELRKDGKSYNEISKYTGISKSTLSGWLRDIQLSNKQIEILQKRSFSDASREKAANTLKKDTEVRWNSYREEARKEFESLSKNPNFILGLALYIGEGNKYDNCAVGLSNCDCRVIRKAIDFFILIGIPKEKIKYYININEGNDIGEALKFWQKELNVPMSQFNKTMVCTSCTSNRKKGNIQKYGCLHIRIGMTNIMIKIYEWMDLILK